MNRVKRIVRGTVAALLIGSALLVSIRATRNDFGLGRNMEILVNLMRELSLSYVDAVDADQLLRDGAEGMTANLDPYTEFLPEEELTAFEIMTTGKYGGVGSIIRKKGDYVIFAQPYEGSPADRAGIRIGDKILEIDGKDAKGMSIEQISSQLKGDPGTKVRVRIERLIGGASEEIVLRRERIRIPGVPYWGYVADGVGYIRHSDFTEGCYDQMRTAIDSLQQQGELRALILDYRNNGGGILQEAIKIISMFVPNGTVAVSTRGRERNTSQEFRTRAEPTLPDLPLAVLVNSGTASSSEIVAGALQDLDRGVLIGQKTFGKGLVQSTRPLGYNTMLKLTTAKYYTPSGRCIQAMDYSAHGGEGAAKAVPDSLTQAFTTAGGRTVRDGGGLTPDIEMQPEYISRFAATLYALGYIEDFVDRYMQLHPNEQIDTRTFSITDADYDDFTAFLADKQVPYESQTRRMLRSLRTAVENDRFEEVGDEIDRIEALLQDDTQTNLQTYREQIVEAINSDIILRHAYARGVTRHALTDDREVACAVEILTDTTRYRALLSPGEPEPELEPDSDSTAADRNR